MTAPARATGIDPRSPCLVGIGRHTWRRGTGDVPEPLDMCAEVIGMAGRDSGSAQLLGSIDAIHAVHCASWAYDDLPTRIAERLGVEPAHRETSMLAGTSGQRMLTSAAERMLRGESEVALVVGAEALATKKCFAVEGVAPPWSYPSPLGAQPAIDLTDWTSPTEFTHDVIAATLTFAVLDSARRAAGGVEPGAYRNREAELFATFTEVAAANPNAWFRTARSAAEIATPSVTNRMIASPYTKYMVAIMDVDMAAALVLTTHGKADALGIPDDRRVYLRGWSFGRDSTHIAERPFLDRSPAMAEASRDAIERAGVTVDDLSCFDLYSCFPAAVLFAADALGIDPGDPRRLTVTGGLPYHGGPSSNYTTHAIADVVDRLRRDGGHGLVSGVGLHMTKHSWAVYSSSPGPVGPPDYEAVQRRIDHHQPFRVVQQLDGPVAASIAACSVTHDRAGDPVSALVVADLDGRARAYARTTDPDTIKLIDDGEPVGLAIVVEPLAASGHTFRVVG